MTHDAEFYFERSAERYKAGDVNGGNADLDHAIELAPDNLEYRWTRANRRHHLGQHPLAIEDFSKFIELTTDVEDLGYAYHALAISHEALNLTEAWLADLDWLIAHDQVSGNEYTWRGAY